MIKYFSKSTYVDKETGEIISKRNAEQNYIITKTTKSYDKQGITVTNGREWGAITINYIRECEPKRQLTIIYS